MADRWTEAGVFERLRRIFPERSHVLLSGVRNGTGFVRNRDRTIDALAISTWPSRGLWIAGIEIKVSRSDWRKELADPSKADDIQQWCDYWYVAAPSGVIPVAEVPNNWGVIACTKNKTEIVKRAEKLNPKPPDMPMVCSILKEFQRQYVTRSDLKDEVAKLAESQIARERFKREELERCIKQFEEASGVSMSSKWDYGNIGDAVRAVRTMQRGGNDPNSVMRHLRHGVRETVKRLEAFLEETEPQKAGGEGTNG